jgi:RecA-family ATPase
VGFNLYIDMTIDPNETLLGDRFMCRGDGGMFFAPSGVGKSFLIVQGGINWSMGKPFLGIVPNGSLRVLYVQAEDDDGDIMEMVQIMKRLTSEERKLIKHNSRVRTVADLMGLEFVRWLVEQCEDFKPELIILNPLQTDLHGDLIDDTKVKELLRTWLKPMVLDAFNCCIMIVSHTPKSIPQNIETKSDLQMMSSIAGSAQLANWPSALNLRII